MLREENCVAATISDMINFEIFTYQTKQLVAKLKEGIVAHNTRNQGTCQLEANKCNLTTAPVSKSGRFDISTNLSEKLGDTGLCMWLSLRITALQTRKGGKFTIFQLQGDK